MQQYFIGSRRGLQNSFLNFDDGTQESIAFESQILWHIFVLVFLFVFQFVVMSGFKIMNWKLPGAIGFPQIQVIQSCLLQSMKSMISLFLLGVLRSWCFFYSWMEFSIRRRKFFCRVTLPDSGNLLYRWNYHWYSCSFIGSRSKEAFLRGTRVGSPIKTSQKLGVLLNFLFKHASNWISEKV